MLGTHGAGTGIARPAQPRVRPADKGQANPPSGQADPAAKTVAGLLASSTRADYRYVGDVGNDLPSARDGRAHFPDCGAHVWCSGRLRVVDPRGVARQRRSVAATT